MKKLDAEKTANDALEVVTIAGLTMAGVWALNLIDATIAGFQEKSRVTKLYFSALPVKKGAAVQLSYKF